MGMDLNEVLKGSSLDNNSNSGKDTIETVKKISFMDFIESSRKIFFDLVKNFNDENFVLVLMDMYSTIISEVSFLLFYEVMPNPDIEENRYKKVKLRPTDIVGAFWDSMNCEDGKVYKMIKDFPIIEDITIHTAMAIVNNFWDIDWDKERLKMGKML